MFKIKSTQGCYPLPTSQFRWVGIYFFLLIHVVGLIGTPLYLFHQKVSAAEWALFIVYFICSSMAITVGYHRLFTHAAYKTNALIRFLLLFFGASTFEQSALKWASQHRQHHQFTDTNQDPYNIQKGFWYAHIGWIMFWKHRVNYDNVHDLQRSKLVMNQHHFYGLWSVVSGVVTPLAIGAWIGHLWGVFVMSVCLRLVLVMNSAFFINSFAHTFGDQPNDKGISAKNHWLGALLTNGEGYHNFHHRYPTDYRNGIRWYQWDPSKWAIFFLSKLHLAWGLKKTGVL